MGVSAIGGSSFAPPWSLTGEATGLSGTPPGSSPPDQQSAAAAGAAAGLITGARETAIEAFFFNLRLSFSDADRASAAESFLRYAAGLPSGQVEGDPVLGSLVDMSQSILAHTRSGGSSALFSRTG